MSPSSRAWAGHEELTFLLEFSRDLSQAPDFPAFTRAVEKAVGRILEWQALAVLPGVPRPRPPTIRGGWGMTPEQREAFRLQTIAAARDGGTPCQALDWETTATAVASLPGPLQGLFLPLSRRHGRPGLLAVLPATEAVGEDRMRLLSGIAQQAALFLGRLERVEDQEQERLAAVLEALPSGVLLVDGAGNLRRANPAGERLLASLCGQAVEPDTPLEALGLPVGPRIREEDVEFSSRVDQRTYVVRAGALDDPASPDAHVVVLTDVTEERARRDQAVQTEKLSALGEMLSGVAHELNNPLSTVIGYSQLLLKQEVGDKLRRRLEMVGSEAERCRRIVQNLLHLARAQPPEKTPVSLNDLVSAVVDLFAYQFRVDNIDLEWEPVADVSPVEGDRHRLQQVLVNLVSNAHHSLRRSTKPSRRLTLRCRETAGTVTMEVTDNGMGIPPAHLERIFEPFFTTKEAGVGTGLGLPLASRTVRDHGGRLSVRSEPGTGATFSIELPALSHSRATDSAASASTFAPSGRRVLIVEDEEGFRGLLTEALAEDGFQVQAASDGNAALALLENEDFDLVLSDLRMPGLGGPELFAQATARRPPLARRFLFMTGDSVTGGTRRFLDDCGAPCLAKPFGMEELLQAMGSVLGSQPGGQSPVVDSPPRGPGEAAPRAD